MTDTPKRRGRPPGPPKEPKPAVTMGRPPKYPEPSTRIQVRIPAKLAPTAAIPEIHQKVEELVVDFLKQKV